MGRRGDHPIAVTAAALGAISGLRSMAAPALLARELREEGKLGEFGPLEGVLSSDGTSRVLALLAGSEMLMDKTPLVPDRTHVLPLVGRAVIGSATAAAYAVQRRKPILLPAMVGAASAVLTTFAAFHLRRFGRERLDLPDRLLGLLEDSIVVVASRAVTRSIADEA